MRIIPQAQQPTDPPPVRTADQWAKELRDMLFLCLRRSDFPTVKQAKRLIEEYDEEHKRV